MQKRKKISGISGVSLNGQNFDDDTDQRLDALIADWELPVEVPDDPYFADRVLSRINNRPAASFTRTLTISAVAAAAVLAIAVGVGIGNIVDRRMGVPAPENQLMNVANDLGIGMTQIDPYEYLLSEEEE